MQHTVTLEGEIDWPGFRREAKAFLARLVPPECVSWHTRHSAATDLLAHGASPATHTGTAVSGSMNPVVPRSFMSLCETVILHCDPARFSLLYRLLWRLVHEPDLRRDPLDADRMRAQHMAQAVRRDMHRMKAFVRFRALDDGADAGPLHAAWFEPAHHIVEAVAPFFVRRFAQVRWAIFTPERSVRWDGNALQFGPGSQSASPLPGAGEALWLNYYRSVFTPPHLRLAMMEETSPSLPSDPAQALAKLRTAADRCRECPIGEYATQAVFGEGPVNATLMVVGEQPGDQEDLAGRPFVGPAGQLFDRAIAELGWSREELYVTNAVKHFKFEFRGKRRMHKTPGQREIAACLHWLEGEIDQVRPRAIIALGATAARALLGRPVAVMRERGHWHTNARGQQVLVTLHPSALLRGNPEAHESAYRQWLDDLALASAYVAAAGERVKTRAG